MLFSSISFLYYFLPITLFLYFLVPKSWKNGVLLTASLIFYGWGEPKYLFLMIGSIVIGYFLAIGMDKQQSRKRKQILCGLSIGISLCFLLYFKYADFFIANINRATGLSLPLLRIALPIGISFYTFQMISYTLDVFWGEKVQTNIIHLATYIVMFPQLIAGPIVRYADIAGMLKQREHSAALAASGIRRFVLGLAKKILIANQLGELCAAFRVSNEKSILFYWLYAIAFLYHIYFDFSGYSDMAIGLGRIFGFRFLENFNYPYTARSITEFWRRWHISLGTWFRDYVYIPLGGNRVAKSRQMRNIVVVWLLTGFWHGASWNFIIWGLLFAVLLIMEKIGLLAFWQKGKWLSHGYVLFCVMISFVIFNATDMTEAISDIIGLFGGNGAILWTTEALYQLRSFAGVLLLAMVGATPLPKRIAEKLTNTNTATGKGISALEPIILLGLLLMVTGYLADGSFNPFLYFRF